MARRRLDGSVAEDAAAQFLAAQGYKIVHRNLTTRFGEVDIVAIDEGMVVFVEVKSRARDDYGYPEARVDRRKQRTLRRIAEAFLERKGLLDSPCRFDVVAMVKSPDDDDWDIELFQDAF